MSWVIVFGKKKIFLLVILSILLFQIIPINSESSTFERDNIKVTTNQQKLHQSILPKLNNDFSIKSSGKSWTYMLYLDADNDIEADAIRDFEWLEEAGGSDENISFVVLLDRIPGFDNSHGNWNGSRIYNVTKDVSPITFESQLMVDLGEVDMANPSVLTDFITYCFENFTADNYILDLWDHGHAAYGVIDDETSSTHFEVDDIQTAIKNALDTSTEEIDIISMDACDMNTIEVAWEMKDLCKYFISSETGTNGYPYKSIAERMKSNPNMNASTLCETMVEAYSIHYSNYLVNCLSVIDQVKLSLIPEKFNLFVSELITVLETGNYDEIFAFTRELTRDFYDGSWVDLVSLIENTIILLNEPVVNLAGTELLELLNQIIIYNWQHESFLGSANGLTIFMPRGSVTNELVDIYCSNSSFCRHMDWQADTLWDEFLDFYRDNYLHSINAQIQSLTLGETKEDCSIEQNATKLFSINFWKKIIYEFTCQISKGDVDFKVIEYDYSGTCNLIGGSYLVNPEDGKTEKCRFRLENCFYLVLVYGLDTTSKFDLEVKESEPIELVCNSPSSQSTGSINGDVDGHFKQDLNHYFSIELPDGINTINLNNSETTNCQLVIYNEDWNLLYFLPAQGYGEVLTLIYNHSTKTNLTLFLVICSLEGSGKFVIEIKNPNEPTPKADIPIMFTIIGLMMVTIITRKFDRRLIK
ncbi:MAG: hypothetical protein EAX90_10515 [Candidatus Heimdallarchaeota archaeon]|nr:hypothetical protein [Candidatus Heimdallarchaeota archaeon]